MEFRWRGFEGGEVEAARGLFLEYGPGAHSRIVREMRELGFRRFRMKDLCGNPRRMWPGLVKLHGWDVEWRRLRGEEMPKATKLDSLPVRVWKEVVEAEREASGVRGGRLENHPVGETPPPLLRKEGSLLRPDSDDFRAWLRVVEPRFEWGWRFQRPIFRSLRRVTRGRMRRLMIFLPPRHGKSELVTIRYAAWRLLRQPKLRIVIACYDQKLANRFSRRVRRIVESCQLTVGSGQFAVGGTRLAEEEGTTKYTNGTKQDGSPGSALAGKRLGVPAQKALNTAAEWETAEGGGVKAVGAGVTGFGADLIIIDDPVRSRADAESANNRDRVMEWFTDDLMTRLEPKGAVILIQTRWHEDDLAGRLLGGSAVQGSKFKVQGADDVHPPRPAAGLPAEAGCTASCERAEPGSRKVSGSGRNNNDKWAVIRLPALAEGADPLGRKVGEALCTERYPREELLRKREEMGAYSFAALYQQDPMPAGGGHFKREWFSRIVDAAPRGLRWCRGYDLAVSTRTSADYTASFRCALDRKTGDLYIADGMRRRMEFPEQRRYIVGRIREERDTEHGIEEALHGQAFVQELWREERLSRAAFRGVRARGDKLTRALAWANRAEAGRVVLVRGPWIDDFLEEACRFPHAAHDDQVDAVSLAVQMLDQRRSVVHAF